MDATFNDYISSRAGLSDLCEIYGKSSMTVEEALNDLPKRIFYMGDSMIVATDDDILETMNEMVYGC